MRRPLLALLVTLAGCPSDPLADDGGESGSTETSTGGPLTTLGDTTLAGTDDTDSSTADSGTSGSTTVRGSGTTDSSTDDSSTGDSGTGDSGTGDSGTGDSGTSDSSTSGGGTSEGSSTDGATTGEEAVGFKQCDSPDDCLPGEGCLNDDVDDPTVAVCFFEDCATADDCPAVPEGGDSEAFCVDVTGDGLDDCVIVCSSSVCPTGMECFLDSLCVWPLG